MTSLESNDHDPSSSVRKNSTRKAPPSPLALTSTVSTQSHLHPPKTLADVSPAPASHPLSSSTNAGRNSLDSSVSLSSSLNVSEFPIPPSALPTIPASPRSPRFTIHHPGSPGSVATSQQQSSGASFATGNAGAEGSVGSYAHDRQRDTGLTALYSQYGRDQESNIVPSLRSVTPPSAGAVSRNRSSGSDPHSFLQLPVPQFGSDGHRSPTHPAKSFATQQDAPPSPPTQQDEPPSPRSFIEPRVTPPPSNDTHGVSPQLPRTSSPHPPPSPTTQPPRAPLPVPPRTRDSARYSHIARHVGVAEMNLDVNEEDLLSTDFITELLSQPVVPSPHSARFPRLPDSPKPSSLRNVLSDEKSRLDNTSSKERHLDPPTQLPALYSSSGTAPDLAPTSVPNPPASIIVSSDGTFVDFTDGDSVLPAESGSEVEPKTRSGFASSMFTSGETFPESPASSSYLHSPNSQSLTVPAFRVRSHLTPHPHMPSTPLTPESFSSAAIPRSPPGPSQLQLMGTPAVRNPATSRSMADHLPIGRSPPPPATEKKVLSPKIRQRHYPRYGAPRKDEESQVDSPSQSAMYPSVPVNVAQSPTSVDTAQYAIKVDSAAEQSGAAPNIQLLSPSIASVISSTHTPHDSTNVLLPVAGTLHGLPGSSKHQEWLRELNSRRTDRFSTAEDDDSLYYETDGEIQVASKVWGIAKYADIPTTPTVVGIAPAVILNSSPPRDRPMNSPQTPVPDERGHLLGAHVEATSPASPHVPPPIRSPPAHQDMPESVKSTAFTEDVHGVKPSERLPGQDGAYHLQYDEIVGYGGAHFLHQDPTPNTQRKPTEPSVKTMLTYITTKSHISGKSQGSSKSHASSKSYTSTRSRIAAKLPNFRRWTWLKHKPLPSLPHDAMDPPESAVPLRDHDAEIRFLGRDEPQGWCEHPEKADTSWNEDTSFSKVPLRRKFDPFVDDSLKIAKETQEKKRATGFSSFDNAYPTRWRRLSVYQFMANRRTRVIILSVLFMLLFVAIILGISLGTLRKHTSNAISHGCSGNATGMRCNLDATCICPSGQSGTCSAPLAKALFQLAPVASQLFATNISFDAMAATLWESQGMSLGPNCASQANLVDVGSVLDDSVFPNRTRWAQGALLWSLFQTGDISAVQHLQSAITKLPFHDLQKDGSQPDSHNKFSISSSGYAFNFASLKVNAPAVKFKDDVSPPRTQLDQVNSVSQNALDRIYSFANASSTQRSTALSTYWKSVLSLESSTLPAFISAFKSSPILIPFDATASPGGRPIGELLSAGVNRTLSFPPPISCFPGLSSSQIQRINSVESQVFGLSSISSSQPTFDSSCFANRPVYGIMDVLRTRLPFDDSRPGTARQAAVLTFDASLRTVLHVGELLNAFPAASNVEVSPFSLVPNQYGTKSHINHVALSWLQAFPTTSQAVEAVKFLLSSPTGPPPPNSTLFNSTSIPVVETATLGNIFLSDTASFVSSFSTPSGGLFFGSSQGDAFRRWALQQSSQATIAWSPTKFSVKAVQEGSSFDPTLERIWSGASTLISNSPGGVTKPSNVNEVVTALLGQ